jgi:hypothetical protein
MGSGVEFTVPDFPQANRPTVHTLAAVAEPRWVGKSEPCPVITTDSALQPSVMRYLTRLPYGAPVQVRCAEGCEVILSLM